MNKEDLKVNDDCGCGHDHDHDHEHEHHHHDTVTLTLDDGSELECPILQIFDVEEKQYIALMHPIDEVALLYQFHDYEDGTIEIESIDSDEEFEKVTEFVTNNFMSE